MADAVPADAKDDAEEPSEDLADADEEEVTLDENHIDIPYQQITVHQAHMESEK